MNPSATPRANKKERKVTVVFRHTDEPVHSAGVEALNLLQDEGALLSASRDSTIRKWDVRGRTPKCTAQFMGHADWVNGLAMVGDVLMSCSNDRTVRAWQARGPAAGQLLSTYCHHSDYVTCLAAASHKPLVATGGLRGELFLMDVTTGSNVRLRPKQSAGPGSQGGSAHGGWQHQHSGSNSWHARGTGVSVGGSQAEANGGMSGGGASSVGGPPPTQAGIYSVASVPTGNVVAAGSSDAMIRLWDTRSGEKVSKLRGHTDNVRCLLVNDDCTLLLSGGADGTMRLWDLSMQRCIQTYVVHADSVWCLAATADWGHVYSGGRDGAVFRTRLATRAAELLVLESQPVTDIAVDGEAGHMWVSTPLSRIQKWAVPREPPSPASAAHAGSRLRTSGSLSASTRKSVDAKLGCTPSVPNPLATIPGLPAIVAHKVLSDRRHVLCKDDQGHVGLWDVLAGQEVAAYGKVEMEAQELALFEARHMPSWFTPDNRLGCLSISLEPPHCFSAEDYAMSLGYAAPDDVKLNYGKMVLEGVFAKWRVKALEVQQGGAAAGHTRGPSSDGTRGPPSSSAFPAGAAPQPPQPSQAPQPPGAQGGPQGAPPDQATYYTQPWPRYWQGVLPCVTCTTAGGVPWQQRIDGFSGAELEPEDVPSWVGDVVLRSAVVTPREAKCAFVLLPAEGSNLPSLLQSRLNAPRILQVHKVATYCLGRLAENQIQLELCPVHLKPTHSASTPPPGPVGQPGVQGAPSGMEVPGVVRPQLELLCNGKAVPYDMSLSAVKKFIWGKQEDIVFHYRVRDPAAPAPLPVITPLKQ